MDNFTNGSLAIARHVVNCPSDADDTFGPVILASCRGGVDFTLLFEHTILSILPACIFLLWSALRIIQLRQSSSKTLSSSISLAKTITAVTYLGLQISLLVLCTIDKVHQTRAATSAAVVRVLTAMMIVILSRMEHSRSIRPSLVLNTYLFFSLLFDITQARTLYLLQDDASKASVFSSTLGIKVALLLLEAQGKTSYLREPYRNLSPETTSGIWSQSSFWWLNDLIITGFWKLLSINDLYELDVELRSEKLCEAMHIAWDKRAKPERRFELLPATFRALKWPLIATIFPRLCLISFQFSQPFLISQSLEFLSEPENASTKYKGYALIGVTFLIYFGIAISTVHYQHRLYRSITMFRGAMVALIYSRALDMESESFNESSAITLMSTDVDRISMSIQDLHEVWARLFEVIIGTTLLARQLGWVCIMPLLVVGICGYLSSVVASRIGDRQKIWTEAVQTRIGITTSCLGSMKSVKMLGYTRIVSKIIQTHRVRELISQKEYRWMIVWMNVVANIPFFLAPNIVFITYAVQAHIRGVESLTTVQTFTSLSLISLLSSPAAELLTVIPAVAASSGCLERVQTFLLSPSMQDSRVKPDHSLPLDSSVVSSPEGIQLQSLGSDISGLPKLAAITIEHASIKPSSKSGFSLKNINARFEQGSLSMIVGPVGCGKTTLLRAVRISFSDGESYCILGEIPCLEGEITVSSSQIAYCAQTVWLQNRNIQQIITGSLQNIGIDIQWFEKVLHACILDEDVQELPDGDQTLIGSKGATLSGGQKQRLALARAIYARESILMLDDVLSALDARTEHKVVDRLLSRNGLLRQLGSTVVLVTHATRYLNLADSIIILNADGTLAKQTTFKELQSDDVFLREIRTSEQGEEQDKTIQQGLILPQLSDDTEDEDLKDLSRQTGDISVYKYFFKHVSLNSTVLYFSVSVIQAFACVFPQVILKWWSDRGGKLDVQYIVPYILLAVASMCFGAVAIWGMLILIVPEAAVKLHHALLKAIMKAPQSFFTKTDRGITLNRFSQDMTLIDTTLAAALLITTTQFFMVLAQASMISLGSTWMALTIPLLIVGLYFLQYVYLRTSRQLRYLDLEAKSPVYTQFIETLDGIATIRAFGWGKTSTETNLERLDASQRPHYLLYCVQRWLNLVLDLMVMFLAVVVVAMAVNLRAFTSAGLLGIALNNILSFNQTLSNLVIWWTQLETSLGAIARIKNFEESTAVEAQEGEDEDAPDNWPPQGKIEIKNISASYDSTSKALNNISITILPGQKVGICGRTGSGKSTLLATILRLLDLESGSIIIDNLDLSRLNRESIREHFITIPQDPFLFTGNVRLNADPLSAYADNAIIAALQKVRLWDILVLRGGLDCDLDEAPLSVGQSQLFCLARAILRSNSAGGNGHRLLLLDEATSNVDSENDALMQQIIREEFPEHTVLSVAHRLETIVNADLVVVMEKGQILEVGNPQRLLEQDESAFCMLHGRRDPVTTKNEK